jgi:phage FluMu gp28-like protein
MTTRRKARETGNAPAAEKRMGPLDVLLPHQARWVGDGARFKIGMWARQTGKSFACAAEAVRDCLVTPRAMWVVLSAGERQALEFMGKCRSWAAAFELVVVADTEDRTAAEAVMKAAEIVFANGSRIVAVPANPSTARGYSANVILDEFAFHDNPDGIWRAIYPSITNPFGGEKKLRIVSTPNGKANKFYDLWTKNPGYSKHKITIHDAIAAGLKVDLEELRAGIDDPEGWAQEYECEFIDVSSVLLPYDLIATCESAEAVEGGLSELAGGRELYLGVDIGRKHDLTVIWALEKIGDVLWTRAVLVLDKVPFREQLDYIAAAAVNARRVAVDATGIGAMLAEELVRQFGEYKVEECKFTAELKQDIFTAMRRTFEDKQVRVPVSRAIREDLHGLQKITTQSGLVRYLAPHNEDGHCDRATALALALRAAGDPSAGAVKSVAGFIWSRREVLA